jgi:hypothetical protein
LAPGAVTGAGPIWSKPLLVVSQSASFLVAVSNTSANGGCLARRVPQFGRFIRTKRHLHTLIFPVETYVAAPA